MYCQKQWPKLFLKNSIFSVSLTDWSYIETITCLLLLLLCLCRIVWLGFVCYCCCCWLSAMNCFVWGSLGRTLFALCPSPLERTCQRLPPSKVFSWFSLFLFLAVNSLWQQNARDMLITIVVKFSLCDRGERYIETIASLDQCIELLNYWSQCNGWRTPKPSKTHWNQWSWGWKSFNGDGWVTPKPSKNNWKQWSVGWKTLNGNG